MIDAPLPLAQLGNDVAQLAFLASAMAKATSFRDFAVSLLRFPVVPALLTTPLALALIGAEALVVAGLWLGRDDARLLALALLALFSAVALVTVASRQVITCGCFGPLGTGRLGWSTVVRNLLLAAGLGLAYGTAHQPPQVDSLLTAATVMVFAATLPIVLNAQRRLAALTKEGYL